MVSDVVSANGARIRFHEGSAWRVEISSVEGPEVMTAVIDEAARLSVRVDRVSQGGGVALSTDGEILEMVRLGQDRQVEVCLWVGARSGWGPSVHARSDVGRAAAGAVRGASGLDQALDEAQRASDLGVRSFLVADIGVVAVLDRARRDGRLPAELVLKSSVSMPLTNPEVARILVDLGIDSLNVPSDMSVAELVELRAVVDVPLDVYIEAPDDLGGVVRHGEVPAIVAAAAPVYLKFAVRNAPSLYPAGLHTRGMLEALGRERVRRARISLDTLRRAGLHEAKGGKS